MTLIHEKEHQLLLMQLPAILPDLADPLEEVQRDNEDAATAGAGAHRPPLRTPDSTAPARERGNRLAAWTKAHESEAQHQREMRQGRARAAVEEGTMQRHVAIGGARATAKAMQEWRSAEANLTEEEAAPALPLKHKSG